MEHATLWWIAAAVLVGAELLTGTFYLLMLSLGMVIAALAAHLGASAPTQMTVAAIVSSLSVVIWHIIRMRRTPARIHAAAGANATRNKLDIGGNVMVEAWAPDGTASVHYRGAPWTAIPADAGAPAVTGRHTVVDIRNNQLVLRAQQQD